MRDARAIAASEVAPSSAPTTFDLRAALARQQRHPDAVGDLHGAGRSTATDRDRRRDDRGSEKCRHGTCSQRFVGASTHACGGWPAAPRRSQGARGLLAPPRPERAACGWRRATSCSPGPPTRSRRRRATSPPRRAAGGSRPAPWPARRCRSSRLRLQRGRPAPRPRGPSWRFYALVFWCSYRCGRSLRHHSAQRVRWSRRLLASPSWGEPGRAGALQPVAAQRRVVSDCLLESDSTVSGTLPPRAFRKTQSSELSAGEAARRGAARRS